MNLLSDLAVTGIGVLLRLAGVSEEVASIVEDEIASLVTWVSSELASGNDPQAELKAMMTGAEVAAKAFEDAELGAEKK